jgi:hypothetical protein
MAPDSLNILIDYQFSPTHSRVGFWHRHCLGALRRDSVGGMSEADELMRLRFGALTVAENLARAVEAGALVQHADGTFELPPTPPAVNVWLYHRPTAPAPCGFLGRFMFGRAYAKAAVPQGCAACYKVRVAPRTLRELVALWSEIKRLDLVAKCGLDLANPYSQGIYAGFFYCDGLEQARGVFRRLRAVLDGSAKLGPTVPMAIKRGCSEFEANCGPSDRYTFRPEQAALEAYLKSRFRMPPLRENTEAETFFAWIDTAYRIGDDTYLDFTKGKPFRPKRVTYDPR